MLETIVGDLLEYPKGITSIAHCCNCQNTFGSGLALLIRRKFPEAYIADCEAFEDKKAVLGAISMAAIEDYSKWVFNIYGQKFYGTERRQLDYEAIYSGLSNVKRTMLEKPILFGSVLGVPYKMGCDRAGGKWEIVYAMLDSLFGKSPTIHCKIVQLPE